MNYLKNKDIDCINKNLITTYLLNNGWRKVEDFPNKNLIQFKKKYCEEDIYINIPSSEKFKDFKVRIKDTIETISILEDKDTSEIIGAIFDYELYEESNTDLFSVRIKSDISERGKIPIDYGKSAIEGIFKLIISAITNEENPSQYMTRINNKNKELENYKLSQTAVGSYIFNIEVKNEINQQISLDKNDDISMSPQRKVIKRIQNGLDSISKKENFLDYENLYKDGLNANMCDALLNFKYDDCKLDIETSVKWAKNMKEPNDIVKCVVISDNEFKILKNISDKYKETDTKDTKISGYIVELKADKNNKGETTDRSIVIQTRIDKANRNVKVYLNESDYMNACNAHAKDMIVSVKGKLIKKGSRTELESYRDFNILEI